MINYIRSEVYRNLRTKGNYIFIIALMALVVFLNIILWLFVKSDANFPYATTKFAFSSLYANLRFPIILCASAVGLILGQEYKNNTLKNTISFGISKSVIYFSKLLISIIYSLIVGILVCTAFIISAYILLENSGIEHLKLLINSLITTIPIFLFSITVAHSFYFVTDKEINIFMLWGIIVILIPQLLLIVGRRNELSNIIASYMPWNIVGNFTFNEATGNLVLGWITPEGILKSIVGSIIGAIIFYFIGLKIFKKKEIK